MQQAPISSIISRQKSRHQEKISATASRDGRDKCHVCLNGMILVSQFANLPFTVCHVYSVSLYLSSCWPCHVSSSFWSIVRMVTCVYDSSALESLESKVAHSVKNWESDKVPYKHWYQNSCSDWLSWIVVRNDFNSVDRQSRELSANPVKTLGAEGLPRCDSGVWGWPPVGSSQGRPCCL